MMKPLNPQLYAKLRRLFHHVKVAHPGVAFRGQFVDYGHYTKINRACSSEEYRVCCFACNDTTFRLYINHMWGQTDPYGRPIFLANCYNEGCLKMQEHRDDLRERIASDGAVYAAKVSQGSESSENVEKDWPGEMVCLADLPPDHAAITYLQDRGFDPEQIGRDYDVRYCAHSRYPLARNRLIIPAYYKGKLFGWQSRHIGELPWKDKSKRRDLPPKYWTCPGMLRGNIVYNLDNARRYRTGVIMEGPTDVWSFGPMGMALWGKTLSPAQLELLVLAFRGYSLVVLLDPEEFDKLSTRQMVRDLRAKLIEGDVVSVKLPEGVDPGQKNGAWLKGFCSRAARKRNVTLNFGLREAAVTR